MEKQVHPAVKDYRNYTDRFLARPQDYPFSTHDVGSSVIGYAHILYLDYLSARIDRDIVRRIWEEYEKEAASLPTMSAAKTRSLDDADPLVIQGELQPLAFALERVTLGGANPNIRDTIDFLVTNARSDIGRGGPQLPSESFILSIRREAANGYTPLTRAEGTLAWFRFESPSSEFCLDPIVAGARNVSLALRTAPQPFVNDGANAMVIAVGTPVEQVRSVRATIYSSSMTAVREIHQTSLLALENSLGVIWDGRDSQGRIAPSGIYIYQISLNDETPTPGKFAVVRK
jgi:hypothetical protein